MPKAHEQEHVIIGPSMAVCLCLLFAKTAWLKCKCRCKLECTWLC